MKLLSIRRQPPIENQRTAFIDFNTCKVWMSLSDDTSNNYSGYPKKVKLVFRETVRREKLIIPIDAFTHMKCTVGVSSSIKKLI